MIGSGIFVTTGEIGPSLVSANSVLLVWIVCAILALCGALSLGELGAMLPTAGGSYVYIRRAFGPHVGCFVGLEAMLVSFPASLAIIALVMGRYLEEISPMLDGRWAAIIGLILITLIHCRGTVFGAFINTIGAVLKIVLLAGFIILGFLLPAPEASTTVVTEPAPGFFSSEFASAVLIVIFAYQGWAIVTVVGGEVRRPERNIPLSILGAVVLVTLIYILMNLVFLKAVAPVDMVNASGEPTSTIGSLVASVMFPEWVTSSLDGLIVLFMFSTIVCVTLAGGRMAYAMADGGQLHRRFKQLNSRGAPVQALMLQAIISVILAACFDIVQLLLFSGLIRLFCQSLMIGSIFILRWKEPDLPRPFRIPLYPVPPLIFVMLSVWIAWSVATADPDKIAACATVIVVLAGLAIACMRLNREDDSDRPEGTDESQTALRG
tara:strand:+ start:1781 stop:3088 length:1308 start_codon:yes stop_codon:yes gene_type:complete